MKKFKTCRINLKIIIFNAIFLVIIFNSSLLKSYEKGLDNKQSKLVKITVKQIKETPPTFSYTVTNSYDYSIKTIIFGTAKSNHLKMTSFSDNVPTSIKAPKGWKGRHLFGHESIYMRILFRSSESDVEIKPNTSLGGFIIEMPKLVKRVPQYDGNGKLVTRFDIKKICFKVRFSDYSMVWGKVIHKVK